MSTILNEEEKKALNKLGVFDCFDTYQLVMKEEQLRHHFRKQALSTHPDRAMANGSDPELMKEAFQSINDSYRLLMDRIMIHKGVSYRTRKVKVKPAPNEKKSDANSLIIGFYKGRFPEKKLRFAEYLYYRKRITWEQLVSALSWQFINRPKLGELARTRGWMNDREILELLRNRKSSERFGLAAVNRGYLTVDKCRELLREQKKAGLPIGSYFLKECIMTESQLRKQLGLFLLHNSKFRRND